MARENNFKYWSQTVNYLVIGNFIVQSKQWYLHQKAQLLYFIIKFKISIAAQLTDMMWFLVSNSGGLKKAQ